MSKQGIQKPLKISIVTPSMNQGQFIEQNILSVINQQYPNVEHIIMDGGSTDGTLKILKKYDDRIIWRSAKDTGQVNALNKGVQMASGDIITYLNSDDYFLPGSLSHIASLFSTKPNRWVTGDYVIVNDRNKPIHQFISGFKSFLRDTRNKRIHLILNYFIQPSTFWTRNLQEEAGPFDENLHYAFDYDYWVRLFRICPPYITREKISAFRIHPLAKGTTSFSQQFDEEIIVLRKNSINKFYIFFHKLMIQMIKAIYLFVKR